MEIQTILLALIAAFSAPLCCAYFLVSRSSTELHLQVLCASDCNQNAERQLRMWSRMERARMILGVAQILLLISWSLLQLYLGNSKSFEDWVFIWAFAPSYLGFVLIAEHFNFVDLCNSVGLGKRAMRCRTSLV